MLMLLVFIYVLSVITLFPPFFFPQFLIYSGCTLHIALPSTPILFFVCMSAQKTICTSIHFPVYLLYCIHFLNCHFHFIFVEGCGWDEVEAKKYAVFISGPLADFSCCNRCGKHQSQFLNGFFLGSCVAPCSRLQFLMSKHHFESLYINTQWF